MMTRQGEIHRAIEQQVLVAIAGATFEPVFPEEFLLDLFDEDLPEDDDLHNHPNLYANGELMDTVDFMHL